MKNKRLIIWTTAAITVFAVLLVLIIFLIKPNQLALKDMKIAIVLKTSDTNITFWQTVKSGVETAKEESGISVQILGPVYENDIDGQIRVLESVISLKPSLIILASSDYNRLVPAVESVHFMGIPVITLDSGVNSEIPASFIATDNKQAGEKAGKKISELLSPGDSIAIISYVKGATSAIDREEGVREMTDRIGKLKIDSVYYCDNFIDKAAEITSNLLKNKPYIKGIVALNEQSSTGAARTLKNMNRSSSVLLIGFDSSIEEIEYLEEGIIRALVVQKPFNMGYIGIITAVDYLKGKKVSKWIDTGSSLITRDNMYDEENQKLLFPVIK
jgi:ribose transport system substrate-binding protein